MMQANEAVRLLEKKHPDLTVTSAFDGGKYYILSAVKDPKKVDYDSPFYAVFKQTGEVTYYSPLADEDVFFSARKKGDLLGK